MTNWKCKGRNCVRFVRIPVNDLFAERRAKPSAKVLCLRAGVRLKEGVSPEEALGTWVDRVLAQTNFPRVAAIAPCETKCRTKRTRRSDHELAFAIALATRSTSHVFLRDRASLWSQLGKCSSVVLVLPGDPPRRLRRAAVPSSSPETGVRS